MVTIACVFVILLISVCTFFSLSSPCTTNELSFPLLIFFFLRCTQTNTPTPTHKHTHTQTNSHGQTNRETDRSSWVLIRARGSWPVLDRSSWVLIGAWLELVLISACGTIGARGSFAWTELDRDGSCLIGAREIWTRGRVDLCWYRDG